MGLLGRLLVSCSHALRQQTRLPCNISLELCSASSSGRAFSTAVESRVHRALAQQSTSVIGSCRTSWLGSARAQAAGSKQAQLWQQTRSLFAATPKHKKPPKNWQKHNPKPPSTGGKIKTPSLAKRRFYVAEDGRIMRRHTHNRHNKSKRSKAALRRLKGDTPLAKGYARKLHKLGFKRKSWYHVKKG